MESELKRIPICKSFAFGDAFVEACVWYRYWQERRVQPSAQTGYAEQIDLSLPFATHCAQAIWCGSFWLACGSLRTGSKLELLPFGHLSSEQTILGWVSTYTHALSSCYDWKQMGCKWVKPDGVITRSDIIWFGYPNTEGKSLQEQLSRKRKSSYRNAVSNMTLLFWHWKRTWIMFMSSLVLLLDFHPQLLRDCSKDIPLDTFGRNFLISKSFVGKSTSGQVRIMSEQQEVYQQKLSDALSLNVKESNRKRAFR